MSLVITKSQLEMMAALSRISQVLSIRSWLLTNRSLNEQVFSCSLPHPFWRDSKEALVFVAMGAKASSGRECPIEFVFSSDESPCQLIPMMGHLFVERIFFHFSFSSSVVLM